MDPTLLLIVAIVSVAIGYAGGAVITASRAGKKALKEDEKINEKAPASQPEPPVSQPIIETPAPILVQVPILTPPVDPNRVVVATLWRELPHGILRADMAGSTIKRANELTADQRSQLKAVQEDLGDWLGPISIAASLAINSVSPPAVVPEATIVGPDVKIPPQPIVADVSSKKSEEFNPPAANDQPVAPPPDRKTAQSIVSQIDEILQAQIKGTELESRGIRLVESATHGVTVWIGLKAYQGMDAIPDAEINTAIRMAVNEWEARK